MTAQAHRLLRTAPGDLIRRSLFLALRPRDTKPGVLIVTRPDLFPSNHGAAVKVDRTAAALSQLIGRVCVVTDHRAHYYTYVDGARSVVSFPFWLRLLGPTRLTLRCRVRYAGIPSRDAFLYYALADWGLLLRAAYVVAATGVRVFQAEFPAYARAALWLRSVFGGHAVLVEHNVEFDRLGAQIPNLGKHRYQLLRDLEVALCNSVDLVLVVSRLDRQLLIQHGVDGTRVHFVPHGVDVVASEAAESLKEILVDEHGLDRRRPILVYHGTYAYPPNLEAVRILSRELVPRLHARGLDPLVLAIGPHPPKRASLPGVVFIGSVATVPGYLKAADVAVVPLEQGGGTRMKILDYLAAGVPVVATEKGVEGLGLVDGREALIRDTYECMSDAVASVLRDPQLASALSARGRAFVASLDWLAIGARYRDLFLAHAILPRDVSS